MFASIAFRSAAMSPYSMTSNPGVNGPKPVRHCGSVLKLMIVVVRPWKLFCAADDLRLAFGHALLGVAPFAGRLDRRLDALRPGVHRQHHLHAAQLGEVFAQRAELVVVERPRRERDAFQLGLGRRDQLRVPVAEVDGRVRRQHVHVTLAVGVFDPDAFGPRDHYGQGVVVMRGVLLNERNMLRIGHGLNSRLCHGGGHGAILL